MWVAQPCHQPRLTLEAAHHVGLVFQRRVQQLDRNNPVELRVVGAVDTRHAPIPDHLEQTVALIQDNALVVHWFP